MHVARATLETLVFAQALRPLVHGAGPLGEYGAETFAQLVVDELEGSREARRA